LCTEKFELDGIGVSLRGRRRKLDAGAGAVVSA